MTDLSPVVGEAQAPPIERFRKRPLEVEMMLWDGTEQRADEIRRWIGTGPNARKRFFGIGEFPDVQPGFPAQLWVEHSKSWVSVHVGTRVAKEADGGGFYPISPAAIAGTFDPAPEPLELTPPEQAAVAKSPHMSTCHEPVCVDCAKELRQLRRYIVAIWPVIEEEATRPLKELLTKVRDHVGKHGDGEVDVWSLRELLAGRDHDAERATALNSLPPVAAALDPTPIPDGEE